MGWLALFLYRRRSKHTFFFEAVLSSEQSEQRRIIAACSKQHFWAECSRRYTLSPALEAFQLSAAAASSSKPASFEAQVYCNISGVSTLYSSAHMHIVSSAAAVVSVVSTRYLL